MSIRRIAITGVGGYWGGSLAHALHESDGIEHILGLGEKPPPFALDKMEYVQLDLRHPMLEEVLGSHQIDAVVHLGLERRSRVDDESFQRNVLGSMNLASAASNVGVKRLVFMSSLRVYGARHTNPSFITEDRRVAKGQEVPFSKDVFEIETYLGEHQRVRREMGIVVLRFAWVLGPRAETSFSRYLDRPIVPTLLGFDPHFQFVHERDVTRALAHSVRNVERGVFNVAGDGVIPLSRVLKRAGRTGTPIPHPLAYSAARALSAFGREEPLPIEIDFLRYSVVGSTERMRTVMGFEPALTGEQAIDAYARSRRRGAGGPIVGLLSLAEAGASRLSGILPARPRGQGGDR